jgi:hypothetical protein
VKNIFWLGGKKFKRNLKVYQRELSLKKSNLARSHFLLRSQSLVEQRGKANKNSVLMSEGEEQAPKVDEINTNEQIICIKSNNGNCFE